MRVIILEVVSILGPARHVLRYEVHKKPIPCLPQSFLIRKILRVQL